jgi:hypothetical protein
MKTKLLILPGMLLAVALLATCTEQPAMAPDNDVEAVTPTLSSVVACDLVKQMEAEVRDYFKNGSNSVRQATSTSMRLLGSACGALDETGIETQSVFLLKEIEKAVKAGYGGAASLGASLARNLIACNTVEGCSINADDISMTDPFALPSLADLQKALGDPTGTFAVRATDERIAAVARAKIPFTHESDEGIPESNYALFGAQLGPNTTWVIANQNPATQPFVVIYGFKTESVNVIADVGENVVGNDDHLGYTFNRWPDMGQFKADRLVNVGVCFAEPIGFPHIVNTPDPKGRMQREGVALFWFTPTFADFCRPTPPNYASILGPVKTFALSLMPRSWAAMFMTDIRTPVIGGGSIDWSEFAPAGLNTQGTLEMTTKPDDRSVFQVNAEVINFTVEARSGGGTPMEVPVEIYVAGNSGEPADAIIGPEPLIRFTSEADGIVHFNDMFLGKPGGYTICVRANVPGFTFTEACTGLIYAKQ